MAIVTTRGLPGADGVSQPSTTFRFDVTAYDGRPVVCIPSIREDRTFYAPVQWAQDDWLEASGLLDGRTGIELSYWLRDVAAAEELLARLAPLRIDLPGQQAPSAPYDWVVVTQGGYLALSDGTLADLRSDVVATRTGPTMLWVQRIVGLAAQACRDASPVVARLLACGTLGLDSDAIDDKLDWLERYTAMHDGEPDPPDRRGEGLLLVIDAAGDIAAAAVEGDELLLWAGERGPGCDREVWQRRWWLAELAPLRGVDQAHHDADAATAWLRTVWAAPMAPPAAFVGRFGPWLHRHDQTPPRRG